MENAERFISYLLSEPFDYTEWRKDNLFQEITLEEISKQAMNYYNEHNLNEK